MTNFSELPRTRLQFFIARSWKIGELPRTHNVNFPVRLSELPRTDM